DDGTSGNSLSRVSAATIETTDFANPTGSLTINRGNVADALAINALPDFNASLSVGSGGSPIASATFAGAVSLAAGKNLSVVANSIAIGGAVATSGGNINLTATGDISLSGTGTAATGGGGFTASADNDANGTGVYSQAGASNTVTTGGGSVSI